MNDTPDHIERALYVGRLRAAADFVEAHPDLPAPHPDTTRWHIATHPQWREHLRVIHADLGEPEWRETVSGETRWLMTYHHALGSVYVFVPLHDGTEPPRTDLSEFLPTPAAG